jgi:hypothetical protein
MTKPLRAGTGQDLTLLLATITKMVMLVIFASNVAIKGMSDQELNEAMLAVSQGGKFLMATMVAGLICTVIGGYVAARVAKKSIYLNAGAVGMVGVSVLFGFVYFGETLSWYDNVDMTLIIPAALWGGHLAKSKVS